MSHSSNHQGYLTLTDLTGSLGNQVRDILCILAENVVALAWSPRRKSVALNCGLRLNFRAMYASAAVPRVWSVEDF